MLYLWIFGNNVEDSMGKGASCSSTWSAAWRRPPAQYLTDTSSAIPMVGASGAVSGVLGAYLIQPEKPGSGRW